MPSRIIQLSNQEYAKIVSMLTEIHQDIRNELGICSDLDTVENLNDVCGRLTEVITDLKTFNLP